MQVQAITRIAEISPDEWNRLAAGGEPFLRHEFLAALESSGAATPASGWAARHLAARDDTGQLVGAMPLYLKSNSWGEFVFDFAWADAYRRSGLRYFPKLVSAVPFTPATGPRLLTGSGLVEAPRIRQALASAALELAREAGASSLHVLFPDEDQAQELQSLGLMLRKDCQFHWANRGYASFEDFLGQFTAEKRKKVRRERRRVSEAGISFRILRGSELGEQAWKDIMPLYASTFWRRGREPYLTEDFFRTVATALPDSLLVVLAMHQGRAVAVAIFFRNAETLYGRYWGSTGEFHSLHFETCYYQGIDYCIREGLTRFEPGTQGEHKIARGFAPANVWSAHWLSDPRFAAAVDSYLLRERAHIEEYMDVVDAHLPFRRPAP